MPLLAHQQNQVTGLTNCVTASFAKLPTLKRIKMIQDLFPKSFVAFCISNLNKVMVFLNRNKLRFNQNWFFCIQFEDTLSLIITPSPNNPAWSVCWQQALTTRWLCKPLFTWPIFFGVKWTCQFGVVLNLFIKSHDRWLMQWNVVVRRCTRFSRLQVLTGY